MGALGQWMRQVHMGLHNLQIWERRSDGGHVQHRIHELYLGSCSYAWTRWRREFTKRQNGPDTKLIRAHWYRMEHLYDEAVARVVARHTCGGNGCPTLTGTPSNI